MNYVDFRSDTVTMPTPAMRTAMANAQLGDDVYGEDPTINALQEQAAQLLGKEAALFVASGTMGNVASVLTHATRGEEVIMGVDSHIFNYEAGSVSTLGGVFPHPLPTDEHGCMDLAQVTKAIRPDDEHFTRTKLICVENSYGAKSGTPLPLAYLAGIHGIAQKHQLKVHMDGARFFNSAVALNLPASDIAQYADSVSFCLSKGLCCPVGSLICGTESFIREARRIRKSLGGGMRQAGVLAAPGIIALSEMIERLADDHTHAKQLAEGLAQIPGIQIKPEMVKTNIIFFELAEDVPYSAPQLAEKVRENAGILIGAESGKGFRAITHYWIQESDIINLLSAIREVLKLVV